MGVLRSIEGAPSHCPLSYVDCGESYAASGATAGRCLSGVTTRGRTFHDRQRPVHGDYAEGRVFGGSDGGGGSNGLGPPNVRATVIVQGGRPFGRSGQGPPRKKLRLRTDASGTYPRLDQSLKIDPRRRPLPRSMDDPKGSAGGKACNQTAAR